MVSPEDIPPEPGVIGDCILGIPGPPEPPPVADSGMATSVNDDEDEDDD